MADWIKPLVQLQAIDLKISDCHQAITEVPVKQQDMKAQIEVLELQVAQTWERVKEIDGELKRIELDVQTNENKAQQLHDKSSMVKKNDEYKAILSQVDQTRQLISELEDRQLELMEEVEEAHSKHSACKKEVAEKSKELLAAIAALEESLTMLNAELEKLQQRRAKAASKAPEEELNKYERIKKSHGGKRVVMAPLSEDGHCGRCHLKVTPQERSCALKGEFETCTNCGAIAYSDKLAQ